MPISSPRRLSRAPPELPELMAASVWMKFSRFSMLRPLRAERADDAGGDGLAEAERVADGQRIVTDPQLVGVGKLDLHQILGLDLQQRDVGLLVLAYLLGGVFTTILQVDLDPSASCTTWALVIT